MAEGERMSDSATVPDPKDLPTELRERDQWLMWDASADAPRRPHWRGDFGVSWTDPDDWHSLKEAREAASERDSWGIGYVFANENDDYARGLYGALDLDGCADDDGRPKEWLPSLAPFADRDAYIEWSPSGTGLHIPLAGFEPPAWWSDCHFSDDEHEGVEAYGSKFFTVTGDRLRDSGDTVADAGDWIEEWLAQAHKSITGEDPRTAQPSESSRANSDPTTGTGTGMGGEWFDSETASKALDHIDPDVSYPMWRDIGFALADEFSGHTALSLFESWSRGGTKWDDDAEIQVKRIIEDATRGGGRSIGTVIYHAQQGGWTPPTQRSGTDRPTFDAVTDARKKDDSGEQEAEATDGGTDTATEVSGEIETPRRPDVRDRTLQEKINDVLIAYDSDDRMTQKTVIHRSALLITEHHSFIHPRENAGGWRSVLHRYDPEEGIYRPDGKRQCEVLCERLLGDFLTNTQAREIVGKITRMSDVRPDALETAPERIIVDNGILNLRNGELDQWTPEEYHRTKIPIEYNSNADCPRIDAFFHEIVENKDVPTLYQLAAHTLYKKHEAEKAAMLVGGGENGKSVYLDLLEHFIGEENVAHQSLQSLSHDQFAANNLHTRFANFHPDMSGERIKDLGMFKKLTGGDTLSADVKFEKPIRFENYASLIFAANTMPRMEEDTHALWRRWIYINFPYEFNDEKPGAKDATPKRILMRELTAKSELEGLLARCVEEIREWEGGRNWFTASQSAESVRETMKRAGEPVYDFAITCLQEADDEHLPKKDVREAYSRYARAEDLPTISESVFGEQMVGMRDFPIETGNNRVNGIQTRTYQGVIWSPRGRQIMGLDRPEDSDQADLEEEDGGPRDREETLQEVIRELGADTEAVSRAMILGRASAHMNIKQAEYAFDGLKNKGVVYQPPDGGSGEWMLSR